MVLKINRILVTVQHTQTLAPGKKELIAHLIEQIFELFAKYVVRFVSLQKIVHKDYEDIISEI